LLLSLAKQTYQLWLGGSPEEYKKLNYEETTNMHVSSGLAHTLNVCRRLKIIELISWTHLTAQGKPHSGGVYGSSTQMDWELLQLLFF
jgi:hypothetical protein